MPSGDHDGDEKIALRVRQSFRLARAVRRHRPQVHGTVEVPCLVAGGRNAICGTVRRPGNACGFVRAPGKGRGEADPSAGTVMT